MNLPPSGDQEEFYELLLLQARTDGERASIMLLWRTGMHSSTLVEREFFWCGTEGKQEAICWDRPKTEAPMRAAIPRAEAKLIKRVLAAGSLPATQGILRRRLAAVAKRAGYSGVTPLTLRHSRAVYLLDSGITVNRVASLLGCSWQVLEKHYAQIEAARLVEKPKKKKRRGKMNEQCSQCG
ncbi:unnamed protein product, partial [marine sediment metagenome]